MIAQEVGKLFIYFTQNLVQGDEVTTIGSSYGRGRGRERGEGRGEGGRERDEEREIERKRESLVHCQGIIFFRQADCLERQSDCLKKTIPSSLH